MDFMRRMGKVITKRILAFCLVAAVCVMSWTAVPKADGILTEGDYQYAVLDDGTVEITKYVGTEEEVVVPDSLGGYKVTVIGEFTFLRIEELKKLTLPEGVTSLGNGAFYECINLVEISMPDSLETIGDYAFWNCRNLKQLNIPCNLRSIGKEVFNFCSGITDICVDKGNTEYRSDGNCLINKDGTLVLGCKNSVIPNGVTSIGSYAFAGCGLRKFKIPNGVSVIKYRAFYGCWALNAIQLPESITEIDDWTFQTCSSLKTVYAKADTYVDTWAKDNNYQVIDSSIPDQLIEQDYIYEVLLDGTVSIIGYVGYVPQMLSGKKVTEIGNYAFYPYSNLTKIVFPNGITKIGENVLCWGISEIVIPDSVDNIKKYTFPINTTIHASSGSYAAAYAKENGYNLIIDDADPSPTEPTKPDTTTQQPQETQTTQQQSTTEAAPTTATAPTTEVSPSMAEVGTTLEVANADCKVRVTSASQENPTVEYVVAKNKKTSEIQIPDSVTINGITYKVTAVAKNTFSGNKKVKKIVIGKNVTSIGKNAFANCKNLKTIVVKTTKLTKKSIAKNVLKGTNKKLTIKVPKNKLAAYKKYFKGKGNKTVRVKK